MRCRRSVSIQYTFSLGSTQLRVANSAIREGRREKDRDPRVPQLAFSAKVIQSLCSERWWILGPLKAPVPSSKIGSCHPGAWWKKLHTDQMIQLRVARANGKWDLYWQQLQRASLICPSLLITPIFPLDSCRGLNAR